MVTNSFKVSLGISVSFSRTVSAPQNENIRQRSTEIETTTVNDTEEQLFNAVKQRDIEALERALRGRPRAAT
jgi:hypothetical protein